MQDYTDKIIINISWILLILFFVLNWLTKSNIALTMTFINFALLLFLLLILSELRHRRREYMLYPLFLWEEINEVVENLTRCSKEISDIYDLIGNIREKMIKEAKNKGMQRIKFVQSSQKYKDLCKKLSQLSLLEDIYRKQWKFMLRVNIEALQGKKETLTYEERHRLYLGYDEYDLLSETEKEAERKYQEMINEVLET